TELQESPKEDAELSMIVDLLRNDIGKVCRPGSVRVLEHKRLEAYQNVYHLVSIVKGELDPGMDAVDLLRATFPGGSITGCPKIRAMEVIDELEPVRRHIYTGSIGYVGFDGTMDLSIAIRTATFTGGKAVFSVGGGIVFDSEPGSEFEETLHKGRTLMNALDATSGDESSAGIVWQNGAFKPSAAASVPLDCEALAFGFGFFETLRVQAGRPILLAAHLQRFELAWREFFQSAPPDVTWTDVIGQLIHRNGLSSASAVVKLVAAAGKPGGARASHVLFASAKPAWLPSPWSAARNGGLRRLQEALTGADRFGFPRLLYSSNIRRNARNEASTFAQRPRAYLSRSNRISTSRVDPLGRRGEQQVRGERLEGEGDGARRIGHEGRCDRQRDEHAPEDAGGDPRSLRARPRGAEIDDTTHHEDEELRSNRSDPMIPQSETDLRRIAAQRERKILGVHGNVEKKMGEDSGSQSRRRHHAFPKGEAALQRQAARTEENRPCCSADQTVRIGHPVKVVRVVGGESRDDVHLLDARENEDRE
ncbi:MAG: chorismate-binding protein, partial [Deltaproteobacteria bacterium]